MLAHELRNPLAPLASVADLLAQSEMTQPDRLRAGAVLARQVGHLTRLIDDLLDVARISEGKFTLRPERITLGSLIERALELVAPQATDAGQTIAIDVADADSRNRGRCVAGGPGRRQPARQRGEVQRSGAPDPRVRRGRAGRGHDFGGGRGHRLLARAGRAVVRHVRRRSQGAIPMVASASACISCAPSPSCTGAR